MKNLIGVMQGRLLPKYKGRYQAFPKDTWQEEFKIASDFVGESIPIIDSTNNRLQGVITESDLLKAYLSIQKETQKIETE